MAITPTALDPGRAIVYDTFSGESASEWGTTSTYQAWRTPAFGPEYAITGGSPVMGSVYYADDEGLIGTPHFADVPVDLGVGDGVFQAAALRFEYRSDMADVGIALRTNVLASNGSGSLFVVFEPNVGTNGSLRFYKKRNDTDVVEFISSAPVSPSLTHGTTYWLQVQIFESSGGQSLWATLRPVNATTQYASLLMDLNPAVKVGVNERGYAGIVTRATAVEQEARLYAFWSWDLTREQTRPFGPTDVGTTGGPMAITDFVSGNRAVNHRGWGATDEDATERGALIWDGAVADHPMYYAVNPALASSSATAGISAFNELPYWLPRKYYNHTIYTTFNRLNNTIRLTLRGQIGVAAGVPQLWGYVATVARASAAIQIYRRNANLTFTLLGSGTIQGGAIGLNDDRCLDISATGTTIGARCYNPGVTPPTWQVVVADGTFAYGQPGIQIGGAVAEFELGSFEVQDPAVSSLTVTPYGVTFTNIDTNGVTATLAMHEEEAGFGIPSGSQALVSAVRYRKVGTLAWTAVTVVANTPNSWHNITGLQAGTQYEVQIHLTGTSVRGGLEDDRNVAIARGFITTVQNTIEVDDLGLNIAADEGDEQLIHVVTPPYRFDDDENSSATLYYRLQGAPTWTYVGDMGVDREARQFSRSLSITTGRDYEFQVIYHDDGLGAMIPEPVSDVVPFTVVRNRIYNATMGATYEEGTLDVEVSYNHDDNEDSTAFVEYTSELNEEWTSAGYMTPDRANRKFNLSFEPIGGGDINLRVTLADAVGVVGTNPLITSLAGLALAVRPTLVVTEPSDIASIIFARFLGDVEGVSIAGFRYRPLTSQLWTNVDPSLITRVQIEDEEE